MMTRELILFKGEKMRKLLTNLVLILIATWFCIAGDAFAAGEIQAIPVKDTVTMVDLGAKSCIPCKMMAPILEELKAEYQQRAAVIFIDVREDPSQGKRFGIMSIPTQIFYDRHGSEIYRHTGLYPKEKIKKWVDMLIEWK
jgi:thioredoxin 1